MTAPTTGERECADCGVSVGDNRTIEDGYVTHVRKEVCISLLKSANNALRDQLATAQREAAGRDARALALIQRMRRFMPVPGEFPGETRIRMSEWEPLIVEVEAVEEALTPAPEAGR